MEINKSKIKKVLSSRNLPSDDGTVTAITKLVTDMVNGELAHPVPETRLGVYLNQKFSSEFPIRERVEPGPVPTAIKLLDELLELRKTQASTPDP